MPDSSPEERPILPYDSPSAGRAGGMTDETKRAEYTRPVAGPEARSGTPPKTQTPPSLAHSRGLVSQAPTARRTGSQPSAVMPNAVRSEVRRSRTRPSESGLYFPWWSLVMMVGMVALAAFGLLWLVAGLSQPLVPGNQTPRVNMVTARPTLSGEFMQGGAVDAAQPSLPVNPTPILQPVATPTVVLPTPIPSPSLPPGDFSIGVTVRVIGVQSSGLNIRDAPGYGGTPRFLAYDGEEFIVVDGPQPVDGLEWWRIEDPDDANRYGWAARNFLMVIEP